MKVARERHHAPARADEDAVDRDDLGPEGLEARLAPAARRGRALLFALVVVVLAQRPVHDDLRARPGPRPRARAVVVVVVVVVLVAVGGAARRRGRRARGARGRRHGRVGGANVDAVGADDDGALVVFDDEALVSLLLSVGHVGDGL